MRTSVLDCMSVILSLTLCALPACTAHLQCAAHEMPISLEDKQYFGPLMKEICESKLVRDKDNW